MLKEKLIQQLEWYSPTKRFNAWLLTAITI